MASSSRLSRSVACLCTLSPNSLISSPYANTRRYYLLRGEKVVPYHKDHRMIAGDGRLRNFTYDESLTRTDYAPAGLSDNQHFLGQKAIGFNCLDYEKHPEGALSVNKIPQGADCPNGLRAELFFPSCWDGVHPDSEDHRSHMAYPSVMDDGECPDTHPVRVPSLFYETIWDINAVYGKGGRLVFSNGDPTGIFLWVPIGYIFSF